MKNIKSFKSFNESDGSFQLPNGDITNWLESYREEIMNYIDSLPEEEASRIDQECKSTNLEDFKDETGCPTFWNQNESLHIGSALKKLINFFYNKYKAEKGIHGVKSYLVFAAALIMFLSSCSGKIYRGPNHGNTGNARKHQHHQKYNSCNTGSQYNYGR